MRQDLFLARADLPLARLSSFRSHNLLSAAFPLDLGSVRAANANAELRIPRQLDQPAQSTPPRAVRFFARKKPRQACRHPHLPSVGLLRTPFCERSSKGHAPLQGAFRVEARGYNTNQTSEHSRRRCHCQICMQVVTDLSEKWLRKFLKLLLSDASNLREFAFSLWTCPRHLAQCCIRKNDVSGNIALVRNFSPQPAQTLEEVFVAFDLAHAWSVDLLRRCLERLG